jgi:hypothetical protein
MIYKEFEKVNWNASKKRINRKNRDAQGLSEVKKEHKRKRKTTKSNM